MPNANQNRRKIMAETQLRGPGGPNKKFNKNGRWADGTLEKRMLELLEDKSLAIREVAKKLGVTKNVIISKMHRDGIKRPHPDGWGGRKPLTLEQRQERARKAYITRCKNNAAKAPVANFLQRAKADMADPVAFIAEPTAQHVTLQELQHKHCRWPYGEGMSTTYCGHERAGKLSYCPYHAGLTTRVGEVLTKAAKTALRGRSKRGYYFGKSIEAEGNRV
jgi:hypothetical protein